VSRGILIFSVVRICVVLLLFFIITYIIAKRISESIISLRRGMKIVEEGNLDYKVATQSNDEIGQLSRSFDKMTVAIKKSRAEISEKVKSQTAEIINRDKYLRDQQKAVLNILEDVDAERNRVASERDKIDAILHSIGDGVFVVDLDLKITMFNQIAADLCGCDLRGAIGRRYDKVLNFVYEKDGKINDRFIKDTFETGEIQEMTNHTMLIKPDGTKTPVADSAAPLKDSNGKVIGCVVVFRDVGKERKIDQAKTEFVSLASHQLRTPLATVKWYVEMLLDEDVGKLHNQQKQYLKEIDIGNERMIDLVNALLNVSRIEMGTFAVDLEKADIGRIADEAIHELELQIKKKNLKLIKKYDKLLTKINLDSKLIDMVFHNLLSNAVKYTPKGGKILLEIKVNDPDILVSVSDTGYGIPKKDQGKIFTKMFRADNIKEKDTTGTGLGLYIVKSIVEKSAGGKIWFKSAKDKGTTFSFTIPLAGMKSNGGSKALA